MASVRKEIVIDVPSARAWDALRDWGALHLLPDEAAERTGGLMERALETIKQTLEAAV